MQVGMFEDTTNTWRPIYMNGEPHCWLSNISPNGAFAQGNQLIFRIGHSGSTTTYSVYNAATQKNSTQSVTSLSTWNQNTFQTMTESLSEQASIGSTYYDNSYIVDPNGQRIYITNGSPGGIPTEYGGACTIAPWYEGAWQDSFHGHFQPAVNPVGHCGFLMVDVHTIGFGNYANPAYIQYGPDSFSAQLYGGNQGDGAYITTELSGTAGPLFTGTLYIDGYSYNNGRGAYSSHVKVDVSSDGNTFTNIYSQTWNPSSNNSPSWISIGSVTNIRYVKVTAIDDGGLSANIFMDALRVT